MVRARLEVDIVVPLKSRPLLRLNFIIRILAVTILFLLLVLFVMDRGSCIPS